LLEWLDRLPVIHFAIDHLGGRSVADAILSRRPLERRLPGIGTRYRHASLDTFMIADELFRRRVYEVEGLRDVRTFVDLGSNVGYFVAWLVDHTRRRSLRGLAVDASERSVRETRWVLEANQLDGVRAVHGLVGAPGGPERQEFFVNPIGLCSSRFPEGVGPEKHGGTWRRVEVSVVDVDALWRASFGDARCDLLKMDIEGGEVDFVRADNPFLEKVDQILLEWHAWVVDPKEIEKRLRALSFAKTADLSKGNETGVVHYRRA
jgi:FkbM family methyltransferase